MERSEKAEILEALLNEGCKKVAEISSGWLKDQDPNPARTILGAGYLIMAGMAALELGPSEHKSCSAIFPRILQGAMEHLIDEKQYNLNSIRELTEDPEALWKSIQFHLQAEKAENIFTATGAFEILLWKGSEKGLRPELTTVVRTLSKFVQIWSYEVAERKESCEVNRAFWITSLLAGTAFYMLEDLWAALADVDMVDDTDRFRGVLMTQVFSWLSTKQFKFMQECGEAASYESFCAAFNHFVEHEEGTVE